MRIAIISDIHANLAAFNAVLDDIRAQRSVGKYWCLGDVVGYGPDPCECIEALYRLDHVCVAGNHDLAAVGKIGLEEFNPDAAAAAKWTASRLTQTDISYLQELPLTLIEGDFTLVHGSPRDPIWEYVLSENLAAENLPYFTTKFCLVGHSHVPLTFTFQQKGEVSGKRWSATEKIVTAGERMIINPGGVGQPRDRDPRASYAIYDSEEGSVMLHRVPYEIRATQKRMAELGLPQSLIARLGYGV